MGIAMVLAFAVGFLPSPSNLGANAALSDLFAKQALSFTFPNVASGGSLTINVSDTATQADLPVQLTGGAANVAVAANGYRVSGTAWQEGVDGVFYGLDDTAPFELAVNAAELAVGANTIYAFGDVTVLGDDPAELVFDEAAQFTLNVNKISNPDLDGNGIPDNPFAIVGPGQIWIGTTNDGATVIIASLGALTKQSLGVPVTIGNVTVTAPSLATLIAADAGASELSNAEQGLLIMSASPELLTLLGDPDWTSRLTDALPLNNLATVSDALHKFAEISIIYEYNGGTVFDEVEVLPTDTSVQLEWRDLVVPDGDSILFFSAETDINGSFAFVEVLGAGWELAQGTVVSNGIAVANLTELSVFAPFLSSFDITSVIPAAGPLPGGNTASVTGNFAVTTLDTVIAAQAAYAIYFGDPNDINTLAQFAVDTDTGNVVTPTSMQVIVPAGPGVNEPTAVDVFIVNLAMPEDFDVLLGGYTYVPAPALLSINPIAGTVAGGDLVVISGDNLTAAEGVYFDGAAATIVINTDNEVQVLTPAHEVGTVDVLFVGAGGSTVLTQAFTFGNPPVAAFTVDDTIGAAPFTVQFADLSTNIPSSWAWDFGDGEGSVGQSPEHTYQNPGVYTVTLTATNVYGSDTATEVDYITVTTEPLPPVADFTATPTAGQAALEVQFEDLSIGGPTAWAWDFENDGIVDSQEQNPTFIYEAPGVYTVSLTASNLAGSDSEVKEDYITVSTPPLFVEAITPNNAWAFGGVVARIDGVGFTTDTISGDLAVTFGGVAAEVISGTDTELLVKVPARTVAGAQETVSLTVSRTGDTTTSSTRTNFFTYVGYTERAENNDGGAFAGVTTTAATLASGTGTMTIVLDADAPGQTATLEVPAPLAKQTGDRFVLARATKASDVFNLDAIEAGEEIANVWYFDIHVYEAGLTTAPLTTGTALYSEVLLTYAREQAEDPAQLTFPVGDTDLLVSQFEDGEAVMFSLDTDYAYGSPLAAFDGASFTTAGADIYQSVPYETEYVAVGTDVTEVSSRLYSLSAFALRQDVVIDLEALNPALVGTDEGPTSGGTEVVIEADGGLAYIDRIVFTDENGNKATADADILTPEGTNEFSVTLESPRFPNAGLVDIEIYLKSDPTTPAAVLEDAFLYTQGFNLMGILLAALLAGLGLIAGGDSGGGGGGPCFIATAAYGTPLAGEIDTLRAVRDTYLLDNAVGSALVDTYYRLSPAIADAVAKSPVLAAAVRLTLIPVIALAKLVLALPHVSLLLAALATLPLLRRRARKGDAKA
jgi:PKD repeat protein